MTYNMMPEEFEEAVGSEKLRSQFNDIIMFTLSGHSWRTVVGLALLFVVGGLQALHGNANLGAWVDMVVPVLLVLEHGLSGNTGAN